ncbi:MAG: ATP-binding protein [Candidatus Acidiferrales bacterium]
MMQLNATIERLIGRENEMRQLREVLRKRRSQLIWGSADSGKSFLIENVLAELSANERRKCICWAGPATRRQLVEHLIRGLYLAGDSFVRHKVQADRFGETALSRWMAEQSALRLRGILLTAAEQGEYRIFVDHLSLISQAVAELLKEIVNRTNTPVYLAGKGYSQAEIGYAWSLYWTDEYRLPVRPLSEGAARELLGVCIERYALNSLDLDGFREELLGLSDRLPGAIVKMCRLAADPRYHYGDRVKLKLLHVDYLMQGTGRYSPVGHSS